MKDRARVPPTRGMAVREAWYAWLPEAKEKVFESYVEQLEISYRMWSVSLNEAIALRLVGRLAKATQTLSLTTDLCGRLAHPLESLLWALGEHAKHYGTVPNTQPIDPMNFRGSRCQRSARMGGLLSRVLLTQRAQFLHKLSILRDLVVEVSHEFYAAASQLVDGTSTAPCAEWEAVEETHYDLNTCFREAIVLLKSFLVVLPEDQLDSFELTVRSQKRGRQSKAPLTHLLLGHRRMTPIAGELGHQR